MLLLQLPRIFGSGLYLQSKNCGADRIAYLYSRDQELFYINGNVVKKVTFCKTLQLYIANGCHVKDYIGTNSCALDVSSGMNYGVTWFFTEYGLAYIIVVVP